MSSSVAKPSFQRPKLQKPQLSASKPAIPSTIESPEATSNSLQSGNGSLAHKASPSLPEVPTAVPSEKTSDEQANQSWSAEKVAQYYFQSKLQEVYGTTEQFEGMNMQQLRTAAYKVGVADPVMDREQFIEEMNFATGGLFSGMVLKDSDVENYILLEGYSLGVYVTEDSYTAKIDGRDIKVDFGERIYTTPEGRYDGWSGFYGGDAIFVDKIGSIKFSQREGVSLKDTMGDFLTHEFDHQARQTWLNKLRETDNRLDSFTKLQASDYVTGANKDLYWRAVDETLAYLHQIAESKMSPKSIMKVLLMHSYSWRTKDEYDLTGKVLTREIFTSLGYRDFLVKEYTEKYIKENDLEMMRRLARYDFGDKVNQMSLAQLAKVSAGKIIDLDLEDGVVWEHRDWHELHDKFMGQLKDTDMRKTATGLYQQLYGGKIPEIKSSDILERHFSRSKNQTGNQIFGKYMIDKVFKNANVFESDFN
ncbi:MAG: hypothetical protein K9L86_00095 [Candidatus Omnitrophica bacterium]|nr:hypothetical protein [Candidatus Omnitrophota bacterium]